MKLIGKGQEKEKTCAAACTACRSCACGSVRLLEVLCRSRGNAGVRAVAGDRADESGFSKRDPR